MKRLYWGDDTGGRREIILSGSDDTKGDDTVGERDNTGGMVLKGKEMKLKEIIQGEEKMIIWGDNIVEDFTQQTRGMIPGMGEWRQER